MALPVPTRLEGDRHELDSSHPAYPEAFSRLKEPPEKIYAIGSLEALEEGLAIIGARFATPYGLSCAKRFGRIASEAGITIISGGARGCDSASHKAALASGGKTVVFLGGGCDELYPKQNARLFQEIIDSGGLVVSEHGWTEPPLPHQFRARNRLIASLAKATLIVEAGLPSGTFSTADEALSAGRELLVVPGSISSMHSYGANTLIYQGATPIIDDESFRDQLRSIFEIVVMEGEKPSRRVGSRRTRTLEELLYESISAAPCTSDELLGQVGLKRGRTDDLMWLMQWLSDMQRQGRISRYPDGTYGPVAI